MVKVRAFVQLICIAAAPLALWLSAPTAFVRGVDLQGGDAARLVPHLSAVNARILQMSPDGNTIVASGSPGAMVAALFRAGALPLPLVGTDNACASRTVRRA